MPFGQKATLTATRIKALLDGVSGSGKSYGALTLAFGLAGEGGRVGVICTEAGRINRYAGRFPDFFVEVLAAPFSPDRYCEKIDEAEAAGLDVLVIDSVSHEWEGRGGILEMTDSIGKRMGGTSGAWATTTPLHRKFTDRILTANLHIICTSRTATEWTYEKVRRGDRTVTVPQKVGLKLQQRPGFEYDFDLWFRIGADHRAWIEKSLVPGFETGVDIELLTAYHGNEIRQWIATASPVDMAKLDEAREQSRAQSDEPTPLPNARRQNEPRSSPVSGADSGRSSAGPIPDELPPQADPNDVREHANGTTSSARICAAVPKGQTEPCGSKLYPGTMEPYGDGERPASEIIAQSLMKAKKVLCGNHFYMFEQWQARQAQAAAS